MAISPETAATTRSIFSMLSRTPRRSTSTPWTLRGRRKRQPSSTRTTERRAKQEERRSPLTDSNRRPPPYHGGALPTELRGLVGEDGSRDADSGGIRRFSRLRHLVLRRRGPRVRRYASARLARWARVDAQLLRAARGPRTGAPRRPVRPDRLRQLGPPDRHRMGSLGLPRR